MKYLWQPYKPNDTCDPFTKADMHPHEVLADAQREAQEFYRWWPELPNGAAWRTVDADVLTAHGAAVGWELVDADDRRWALLLGWEALPLIYLPELKR